MNLKAMPSSVHATATASGIGFAKNVVDSFPGEPLEMGIAINAKRFGYHVNYRFEGVEVSDAYYDFVSFDSDPDKASAPHAMRALLSKIELRQALAPNEVKFAHAPVIALSLTDTQAAFCFSLADLLSHAGSPWTTLACADLESGVSQKLDLSLQWL